jgi:hypothetical protein
LGKRYLETINSLALDCDLGNLLAISTSCEWAVFEKDEIAIVPAGPGKDLAMISPSFGLGCDRGARVLCRCNQLKILGE